MIIDSKSDEEVMRKFTMNIPEDLYMVLREEAKRNERSIGQQIRAILKERYRKILIEK